jgi:excisionase family DNA binding protein
VAEDNRTIIEQIAARKKALTLKEFAELLNVSYNTVQEMAAAGRIKGVMRIGGAVRLDPKTTAQWLQKRAS